jgi:hypothetical protein
VLVEIVIQEIGVLKMADKTSGSAAGTKKRKTRVLGVKHYLAKLYGVETPVIVVAKSEAEAIKALVTLRAASYEDMMASGRLDHPVVDVTKIGNAELKPEAPLAFSTALGAGRT